jgi:small-conductance mechanosensitive channel
VVPNADLITHQVVNWTYSDRFARIHIPVGVAYGSDVELVLKILHEVADGNPAVAQYPAPFVFFKGFGDSSLDFELQVHLQDLDNWFTVQGKLCKEIERRFREAGVEIPFPQRDLHLRSVDQPLITNTVLPPEKHLHLVEQEPEEEQ